VTFPVVLVEEEGCVELVDVPAVTGAPPAQEVVAVQYAAPEAREALPAFEAMPAPMVSPASEA
jgi:hypothetical protein